MTILSQRQTNNDGSLNDNPFTETDKWNDFSLNDNPVHRDRQIMTEVWMTILSQRQTNNAGSVDDSSFTETDK